jgi:hypothetical protein
MTRKLQETKEKQQNNPKNKQLRNGNPEKGEGARIGR